MFERLELSGLRAKPRLTGLTCLIDTGWPTAYFADTIQSHHSLIDVVKFGWCTALLTQDLERKLAILREHRIQYLFGGTMLEIAQVQNRVDEFAAFVAKHQCPIIEVSDGTVRMTPEQKRALIKRFVGNFTVWSEVGFKDPQRSLDLSPSEWIEGIRAALASGASMVLTEARESGTSGICSPDGEIRCDLVEEIIGSGINLDQLMFEAPHKHLQGFLVRRVGRNVNLANIAFGDVVSLETLRLGLCSDTLET
jgi:phosphosulfolactate synthase